MRAKLAVEGPTGIEGKFGVKGSWLISGNEVISYGLDEEFGVCKVMDLINMTWQFSGCTRKALAHAQLL